MPDSYFLEVTTEGKDNPKLICKQRAIIGDLSQAKRQLVVCILPEG